MYHVLNSKTTYQLDLNSKLYFMKTETPHRFPQMAEKGRNPIYIAYSCNTFDISEC